jgi:hypothetical protein
MKYTLDLPDELNQVVNDMGFDVNSWFQASFLKPLVERFEHRLQKQVIDQNLDVISASVDQATQATTFQVVEEVVTPEPPTPTPDPTPTPEPVQTDPTTSDQSGTTAAPSTESTNSTDPNSTVDTTPAADPAAAPTPDSVS